MFRFNVSGILILFLSTLPMAASQSATSTDEIHPAAVATLFACVNNNTGAIRIVESFTTCKATEHKIQWNQKGPRGLQGLQGATGAEGPQGPQGPAGISVGYSSVNTVGSPLLPKFPGIVVVQTGPVAADGDYFISASAFLTISPVDELGAFCYDTTASNGNPIQFAGSSVPGDEQASITDRIRLQAGDSLLLRCYGTVGGNSSVINAGITATLIDHASDNGTKSRRTRKIQPPGASSSVQ
jgi:hypothetical protein